MGDRSEAGDTGRGGTHLSGLEFDGHDVSYTLVQQLDGHPEVGHIVEETAGEGGLLVEKVRDRLGQNGVPGGR